MSSFLSNIIGRHAGSENILAPRVRGVFEPRRASFERPNIPTPWQDNEAGTVGNESNDQYLLGEPPTLAESTNAPRQVLSNKAVKKGSLTLPTGQDPQEQTRRGSIGQKSDEQPAPLHKAVASTRSMNLTQQRVLERVRLEVPRDEKSVVGFSSDAPDHKGMDANTTNRQTEQVIKPLLKTKAPFGKDTTPWLQEGEGRTPSYSSKVKPKTDGSFSQHSATLNILGGSQSSIAQPIIKVHIGRIEIKATKEVPVKQTKSQTPERRVSLDEFLKKRDNKL